MIDVSWIVGKRIVEATFAEDSHGYQYVALYFSDGTAIKWHQSGQSDKDL